MRLGAKRRIHIYTSRTGKRKLSVFLLLLFLLLLLLAAALYFLRILRPAMLKLAENQAELLAEQAVQRAVGSLLQNTDSMDFVTLSHLEDGAVCAVEANLTGINRLKASAAIAIQEAIAAEKETTLTLPLGTLFGYDLLAGVGPRFSVRLMPYGRALVDFKTNLSEAGINQTHLTVSLTARVHLGLVLPTATVVKQVVTELPVIDTVLVGKVPDSYVNIDRQGEEYESDVLDLLDLPPKGGGD